MLYIHNVIAALRYDVLRKVQYVRGIHVFMYNVSGVYMYFPYVRGIHVFSGCNTSLQVTPMSRTHLTYSSSSVNCNYKITSTNGRQILKLTFLNRNRQPLMNNCTDYILISNSLQRSRDTSHKICGGRLPATVMTRLNTAKITIRNMFPDFEIESLPEGIH